MLVQWALCYWSAVSHCPGNAFAMCRSRPISLFFLLVLLLSWTWVHVLAVSNLSRPVCYGASIWCVYVRSVQSVGPPLRRMEDVITWSANAASLTSAGCVLARGNHTALRGTFRCSIIYSLFHVCMCGSFFLLSVCLSVCLSLSSVFLLWCFVN